MAWFLLAAVGVLWMSLCNAQEARSENQSEEAALKLLFSFEAQKGAGAPTGWMGGPAGTVLADDQVVHGGRWSARIERHADSTNGFSALSQSLPMDFAGAAVELRGFLRTDGVSGFVGLWMREDGRAGPVVLENMQKQQVKGTNDWKEYSITLPVHKEAKQLVFGVLLAGTGKAWADDLRLLVDGKPIWEAPKVERPKTGIDRDHEFDGGSNVKITELSKVQIENLATLGRVWGFLKYHHPLVTAGQPHWDYDLFRVLPAVLAAGDHGAANTAMLHWITALGPVAECNPCAKLEERELHLRPDLGWLANEALLGTDLGRSLRAIHRNRLADVQFYVSLAPNVGNPSFENESAYEGRPFPDSGLQILGLFRFWNIIEYWFPYRDVLGEDWGKVLLEFIPKVTLARSTEEYQRELMALIARAHDTHANLWSSLKVRPPTGDCQLPVILRFVENRPVVTGYSHAEAGPATTMKVGDLIEALDGEPVANLIERWKPYYAASNEPTRLRDLALGMTRGSCADLRLTVRREKETLQFTAKRTPLNNLDLRRGAHDLTGETFRLLSGKIAYLKLSSVKAADAAHYVEAAAGTAGMIIDIRNYPAEFVVFALGSLLVNEETPFARFTNGDLSNPGAFHWTKPVSLSPQKPHYAGKLVILVDEASQSQSEYTAMAFRANPQAVVIGSTTAGADGNISPIPLPVSLRSMISGIGVFYPDKRPTQRIGILPDVEVKPTIVGIRAGRDEVLEEAIRRILGPETPLGEIQKMIRP